MVNLLLLLLFYFLSHVTLNYSAIFIHSTLSLFSHQCISHVLDPPTATDSGQNKTLRRGSSETLACPVDGNPEPSIVWYKEKEGGSTVLSTRNELKFLDAKSDYTGCYTCSASNSLGTPINITQCIIVGKL